MKWVHYSYKRLIKSGARTTILLNWATWTYVCSGGNGYDWSWKRTFFKRILFCLKFLQIYLFHGSFYTVNDCSYTLVDHCLYTDFGRVSIYQRSYISFSIYTTTFFSYIHLIKSLYNVLTELYPLQFRYFSLNWSNYTIDRPVAKRFIVYRHLFCYCFRGSGI